MKDLLIGNAAVARGLYEGGCAVISSYPGTPSTEITEFFAKYDGVYAEWAPNEKVAMEAAFGSALRGKRSACCMKHVGLNVAADPLFTMSYTGVNAGIVICVADDPACTAPRMSRIRVIMRSRPRSRCSSRPILRRRSILPSSLMRSRKSTTHPSY